MKKLLLVSFLVLSAVSYAQIKSFDSTYIDGLTNDISGTYKQIVKENLKLTEDQAKVFWPLFDEYLSDYNGVIDKRVANTEEYMMNYYSMDNETAEGLLKKGIELEEDILDLKKDYIEKMLEKLPAPLVGKFFQIDARVFALINAARLSSIPLVRESE